jgi:hypothetical protein
MTSSKITKPAMKKQIELSNNQNSDDDDNEDE